MTKRMRRLPPDQRPSPEESSPEYAELLGDQLVAEFLGVRYTPRVYDPVFEETWEAAYAAARDLSAGDCSGARLLSETLRSRVLDLGPDDIVGAEHLDRLAEMGGAP